MSDIIFGMILGFCVASFIFGVLFGYFYEKMQLIKEKSELEKFEMRVDEALIKNPIKFLSSQDYILNVEGFGIYRKNSDGTIWYDENGNECQDLDKIIILNSSIRKALWKHEDISK